MPDVVVIGGGITGSAAALSLAEEGVAVTLMEKSRIAAMASGWTLGGVRQSGRDRAELPLARAAVAIWPRLGERLGSDVHYRRGGNLRLARDENEVEIIRALVDRQRDEGLDLEFLADNAVVRALAPAISEQVLAASFCPSDGHADPIATTLGFAEAAKRKGCSLREGVTVKAIHAEKGRVTGVETTDGLVPAGAVIVAAGVNTPELLAPLGLCLPLRVTLVHVLQTEAMQPLLEPVFGVANADCAGRQEADGRLRVTSGSLPFEGDAHRWREDALAPDEMEIQGLRERVGKVLPAVKEAAFHRAWGGLVDLTPDALPVLDAPDEISGLVTGAGFSGHGFCLGPASGEVLADLALGRKPRHELSAFRLARFAAADRRAPAALSLHG
ncbi:MAG: FAD-binding oxidoreductase [Hyphomicrobiales bacterium]|nr:FAD-binding oxidoreductase [Hyphomicrobiales bacterium]